MDVPTRESIEFGGGIYAPRSISIAPQGRYGPPYDKSHNNVRPEMLDLLKRSSISEYSIFRRGELHFLYMHIDGRFRFDLGQGRSRPR